MKIKKILLLTCVLCAYSLSSWGTKMTPEPQAQETCVLLTGSCKVIRRTLNAAARVIKDVDVYASSTQKNAGDNTTPGLIQLANLKLLNEVASTELLSVCHTKEVTLEQAKTCAREFMTEVEDDYRTCNLEWDKNEMRKTAETKTTLAYRFYAAHYDASSVDGWSDKYTIAQISYMNLLAAEIAQLLHEYAQLDITDMTTRPATFRRLFFLGIILERRYIAAEMKKVIPMRNTTRRG